MAAAKKSSKSGAAAKAKSSKAGAAAKRGGRKPQTVPQRAQQKLRENFKHLSEHGQFVRVHPPSGRTLFQQLQVDIAAKDAGSVHVFFGLLYYETMTMTYSDSDSYFGLLKPDPLDLSPPNPVLLQVETLCYRYLYIFV